jgi:Flp pilus assembly protein TadG
MKIPNLLNKRRNHSSEVGQSLVELALIITFLIILVAGLVDLGRMIFTYLTMRDAAQEGAVYGSIEPAQCTNIAKRVEDNLPLYQTFDPVLIEINGAECTAVTNACSRDIITVTVSGDFDIRMPLLGLITGDTVELSATINDTILSPDCP